jgi:DUF971 family protein
VDRRERRWSEGPGCATIECVTTPPAAFSPATPATTPVSIHAEREARTLAIEWSDGHRTTFDFTALRWLCPCAYCRGEAGMPGWLDSAPTLTAEQTRLTDLHLVGNYAVSPHWADGHKTGYYPFVLLRDRCPCAECTARRAGAPGPGPAPAAGSHEDHRGS